MAASDTEIANLALGHLGTRNAISDLATERSAEALACRTFFSQAREQTLREFPWSFATTIAALSEIEEQPNTEWAYSYVYPAACLMFRRILSGSRNDSRQSRIPFKLANDGNVPVIFTDMADAYGEWTTNVTAVELYPPDFVMAMSLRLAAYVAPRITGGDPFKMSDRALQLYQFEIAKARANNANEEVPDEEVASEFERAR